MTEEQWSQVQYFTPKENWGDPLKMDFEFLKRLDDFRKLIQTPVIITCGTGGQHRENSKHHQGIAVDCVIPGRPLLDNWLDACRMDFTSIGFYPDWEFKDKRCGGLHLEWDELEDSRRFWLGIGKHHWDTQYLAMNEANLKTFYLNRW